MAQSPSIFITGGASGIGRAVAEHFSARGWFVGIYDVDEVGARLLQSTLGSRRCHAARLDVCEPLDWAQQIAAFGKAAGGRLDVLFNNAGVAATAPFHVTEVERHHRLVDVNVKGVINGCHAAWPLLRATPHSRVINMCSAAALHGQPMLATYSATKAAIHNFTEALDIEWRPQGVRVVDVMPLFVDTAMVRDEVFRMKTVQRLGVRLGPQDVADTIWRIAQCSHRRLPLHVSVGWQTTLFSVLSKLSPNVLNHWVTARMAAD